MVLKKAIKHKNKNKIAQTKNVGGDSKDFKFSQHAGNY
jgi:hypothetical protein